MNQSAIEPTTQAHHQTPQSAPLVIKGLKFAWKFRNIDEQAVRSISYEHNLSLPVSSILYTRGYHDPQALRSFLFCSYEENVPAAHLLKGIVQAAERIAQAIKNNEKILVFGDYDVDGITSTSLLLSALIPLGANINFFLPNRKIDGYGLSTNAVAKAKKNGYSLIITVDNGITAFEAAQAAADAQIDLIITDHHKPLEKLPTAHAIIDPQQADCQYPFKNLAGVGVSFKLVHLIYQLLGHKQLPAKAYELLLLGTVADVVPLVGENRYWVQHGLAQVNKNKSIALRVLADNSKLTKETLNSLDIGFMIAPQINALGRLDDPRSAVKFLISSNQQDVEKIGAVLHAANEERKIIEQNIYKEVEISLQTQDLARQYVLVAAHNRWPAGVIGLVAGKLTHAYGKPAFLFHLDSNGIARGSCRSIPEYNVFAGLQSASDLLIQYGGHAFAAGVKLKHEHLQDFKERISQHIAQQIALADLCPKITIDTPLQMSEITKKFSDELGQLEPFGNQNPQPLFCINNVTLIKQPQLLKEKHVKCMVFAQGVIKPVIFFNRPDLFPVLQNIQDKPFHLAAHVIKNEWEGTIKVELQGIDIALQP